MNAVCQRMIPFFCLSVVFLATWRLEAAALIGTHPSTSTSSFCCLSFSLTLFLSKIPLSLLREREGWTREEEAEDGGARRSQEVEAGLQGEDKDRREMVD